MKVPCSSVPVDRTCICVLLCLCAQGPLLFPCDPHHGGFTSRLRKCISSDSDKVRKCRQTGSRSRKRRPVSQIGVFPSDDSCTEFSLNGSTPNKVPHRQAWIGTSSEHSVCLHWLHWVWEIVWIVLKGVCVCGATVLSCFTEPRVWVYSLERMSHPLITYNQDGWNSAPPSPTLFQEAEGHPTPSVLFCSVFFFSACEDTQIDKSHSCSGLQ